MEIFSLIPIILITFFPILIWGYIFSYLDNSPLSGKRFAIGIIAGSISVLPVLFMTDILSKAGLGFAQIFPLLGDGNLLQIVTSFSIIITLIGATSIIFSLGLFFEQMRGSGRVFIKNFLITIILGILFALFHTIASPLSILSSTLSNGGVSTGGFIFDTIKLVLFYYLVIAIVEEVSKHFCMVTSSSTGVHSIKQGVLFSVFIALGFGFIENILYLKNISDQSGILNIQVLTTWIFRSIFSLVTHIICSVIVGLYFSRGLIEYKKNKRNLFYTKTVLFGFIFSVILHAIFDISLTVGFTGIIFIYFFGGYIGITKIFYQEE